MAPTTRWYRSPAVLSVIVLVLAVGGYVLFALV